jgi:hypothetical protein
LIPNAIFLFVTDKMPTTRLCIHTRGPSFLMLAFLIIAEAIIVM